MRTKRIILSAGGTGGHLFPAQAVATHLQSQAEILFVASGLSTNRFFDRSLFPFQEVSSATFSFSNPLQMALGSGKIFKGVVESLAILKKFQPDLVVGFGSFCTLPLLIAATLKRVPIVLHEQNAMMGRVNRLFLKVAKKIALTFPVERLSSAKTVQVQFPLRSLKKDPESACSYFSLSQEVPTLLVFGGSQGAQKLNQLIAQSLSKVPLKVQVIHLTGNALFTEEVRKTYQSLGLKAVVKEFEKRMDLALSLADCAITRAGASTIAELIATETPAILIPFPFATGNHQEKNGNFFVQEVGGGYLQLENQIEPAAFAGLITRFISDELLVRREKIHNYLEKTKLQTLAEVILELHP